MLRTKFFLLCAIFSFIVNYCFAQKIIVSSTIENKKASSQSDTIYYDFNRQLKWEDFKGKPVINYFAGAVTASGFAFDSQMDYDGKTIFLKISVYTFFTKHDSWRKPDINSLYHLLHEQHHFDITRIGAQNFLNMVQNAHFTKDIYIELLSSLFDEAHEETSAMQKQYDNETNHSINEMKQIEWNDKIASQMQSLKQNQGYTK